MKIAWKVTNALVVVAGIGLAGCAGKENPVAGSGATSLTGAPKPAADQPSATAPDMSTPKATVIAFGKAAESGDVALAKAVSLSDPKSDKLLDAFVPLIPAMKHLSEVAEKKFGAEGKGIGSDDGKEINIAKNVENAHITETGDTATAIMPDDKNMEPLKLKKVDGKWKIDFVASMGKQTKPEDVEKILPMFEGMAKAAKDGAADIESGKYKTAKEAKDAVGMMMAGAVLSGAANLMKDGDKTASGGAPETSGK